MTTTKTPPDWRRAAAEAGLDALMLQALAEQASKVDRPHMGHLGQPYAAKFAELYRELSAYAEAMADTFREYREDEQRGDAAAEGLLLACDDEVA